MTSSCLDHGSSAGLSPSMGYYLRRHATIAVPARQQATEIVRAKQSSAGLVSITSSESYRLKFSAPQRTAAEESLAAIHLLWHHPVPQHQRATAIYPINDEGLVAPNHRNVELATTKQSAKERPSHTDEDHIYLDCRAALCAPPNGSWLSHDMALMHRNAHIIEPSLAAAFKRTMKALAVK